MTVSGNGAGDGEGADSAGGAAGATGAAGVAEGAGVLGAGALSPTADADFSTVAVVVIAAGDSWAAVVVVGVALVGVVVCWLCAVGAALDVAGAEAEEDGAEDDRADVPDSVTGEVAADPDVGVPDVAPELAEVVGLTEVVGVPAVVGLVGVVGVVDSLSGGALGVLVGATAGTNSAADGGTV